jgi:hypothetical protein
VDGGDDLVGDLVPVDEERRGARVEEHEPGHVRRAVLAVEQLGVERAPERVLVATRSPYSLRTYAGALVIASRTR